MTLLRNGEIVKDDNWSIVADDSDLPKHSEQVFVSLQRYLELQRDGEPVPGGVVVSPADDVLALAPYIEQLPVIGIDFPVYTDGRGYSHARLLRKRLGYTGELRALGDVREDCVQFMIRSGIDSFDFVDLPDTQLLQQLTSRFKKNYQPSYALPKV